jgi:hypothetical protein
MKMSQEQLRDIIDKAADFMAAIDKTSGGCQCAMCKQNIISHVICTKSPVPTCNEDEIGMMEVGESLDEMRTDPPASVAQVISQKTTRENMVLFENTYEEFYGFINDQGRLKMVMFNVDDIEYDPNRQTSMYYLKVDTLDDPNTVQTQDYTYAVPCTDVITDEYTDLSPIQARTFTAELDKTGILVFASMQQLMNYFNVRFKMATGGARCTTH